MEYLLGECKKAVSVTSRMLFGEIALKLLDTHACGTEERRARPLFATKSKYVHHRSTGRQRNLPE